MNTTLTAERLRELLHYDPETGIFTWLVYRASHVPAGAVAGWIGRDGYWRTEVDYKGYLLHRLAWLWVHGEWPPHTVDHIDGNPSNNRLSNLRLATHGENKQNVRGARRDSKSGLLGVHWHERDQEWRVELELHGERVHTSSHKRLEDAAAARRAAELKFHPFSETSRVAQMMEAML